MPQPAGLQSWDSLESVSNDVVACTLCRLAETRTQAVPGEGSTAAAVMFIGEGPGFNEDQQGRPFVGRAGKLLDDLLGSVPIRREDVFITNIVKCRPPDNRDPLPDEVAACSGYLKVQIELLNPRVIATLGRHSLLRFVPDARISRDHGTIKRWQGRVIYPLYHPAAALRSTQVMQATVEDFKRLPQAILAALTPVESATPNDRARQHADQPTEKPGTTDQSTGATGYSDVEDEDEQMTMF